MAKERYEFKYRRPRRRRPKLSRIVFFLLLIALLAYPFYEGYHLTTDEHTAKIANLPANLKNLRIVFVSDIHKSARYSQQRVEELIQTVNEMNPDLVLLGGDYADESDEAIEFFHSMPKIQARLGVFGVVGNHDRTEPESNLSKLMNAMNEAGVTALVNTVARIKVGQTYLYVAGVDDYDNGFPDVAGVASQVSSDDFVIFMGHNPDLLTQAFAATGSDGDNHWFDMALFGHTHGGQITFFGTPLLRTAVPNLGERYLTGWREENRASILISNGVGTSYFPVRLFAPAQIHLITLKAN